MIYNKNRHKELVKRFLDLKHQGKTLFEENQNEHFELRQYEIAVWEQVYWTHRRKFVSIIKDFIADRINFDEFETSFSSLCYKVNNECNKFQTNLQQIETFQPSKRTYSFANSMSAINRTLDEVLDEMCTEQDLKNYVNETLGCLPRDFL